MKLFDVATFGGNNTLYLRAEVFAAFLDEAFPHRLPRTVHSRLELAVLLWRVL